MKMHTFMLTGTVTYYRNKYIELYSGLGLGLSHLRYRRVGVTKENINKKNFLTADIRAIGFSIGNEHIFAAVELGGMFLIPRFFVGKIASVSFGCRF